jgi:tRNA nucleotidyltransferase (CCA-adding enzyme)
MRNFEFTQTQLKTIKALNTENLFVVGGAVRDLLLDEKPQDIDLATDLYVDEIKKRLSSVNLTWTPDQTAEEHGIIRVIDPDGGELIDVATFRRDEVTDGRHATVSFTSNINEDLLRRDLTINAMAVRIDSNGNSTDFIDPYGGLTDLQARQIRLVGDPVKRIEEDYLRMMRVARFATRFNSSVIDQATIQACQKNAHDIHRVSKERIQQEIMKALKYSNAGWMFRHMHTLGLLYEVMTDLHACVGISQNKYHKDDLFEHLCFCVDNCIGKKYIPELKLATLLHDVGKWATKAPTKDGDFSFHNHEVVGATMTYNWMKQYKFSTDQIKYVTKLVRGHQWRFYEDSTEKSYRKWLQTTGRSEWRDLVRLRIADRKGNRAKSGRPGITREMKDLIRKCRAIIRIGQPLFIEDLAINGDDLKVLGLKPGKIYKDIFSNIMGIVTSDPSRNNRDWLLSYVDRNYIQKNKTT